MEISKKLIGPCATPVPESQEVNFDFGGLIQRLILFDKYILESFNLKEFDSLIRVFGYDGVITLLKSGAINIYCSAITVAQLGQADVLEHRKVLPLGSYHFEVVRALDQVHIHNAMQELHHLSGLTHKQVLKLKSAIASVLVQPPATTGLATIKQLESDLRANVPNVALATAIALKKRLKAEISPSDFLIRIHPIDERDFQVETNISQRFGLNEEGTHQVVERALLAIGGLNQRIETMNTYSALSGFQYEELPLFEQKLEFLVRNISPEDQEAKFKRVTGLTGFPDLSEASEKQQIDINKVLEIRNTPECRHFREWLRSVDSVTDEEIVEQFGSVKEKLLVLAQGNFGKTVRWLTTTGVGCIPGIGLLAGPAAGFLDTFLIEKVLPDPKPISFLSQLYPSIFRKY